MQGLHSFGRGIRAGVGRLARTWGMASYADPHENQD
jgi:hypothetical protein